MIDLKEELALDQRALALVELLIDESAASARLQLPQLCRDDQRLLQRVSQLLARATETNGILPELSFQGLGHVEELEDKPARIGHFRIVECIGRGGMGVVYKAARDDGLYEQVVAIKLVQSALPSAGARDRFFQERQILARLNHPAIVRILDGGDYEGRPYLVMEYCDGLPLNEHVRTFDLPLPQRLALFMRICDAVQYAHRQLVVHADLKPTNILVDGQGQVRLLDFGIASLIDSTTETSLKANGFTRAYASPERRAGMPATVAGDVYSLGALLFELLCGAVPDRLTNTQWSPDAGEQTALLHPAWTPPSTTAAEHGVARYLLRGDLDAIVGRSVEPIPENRYPDVAALLDDLQRYFQEQPIAAHPDGWFYRARKFIRRHRRGVTVAGITGLFLMSAATFSTLQFLQAENARLEADRRFFEVRSLVHYMLFDFNDELASSPGTVTARLNLAQTARRYLEQLAAVPDAPTDLRLDAAKGYIRLAGVLGVSGVASLGRPDEAGQALEVAERILTDLMTESPSAAAHTAMGEVLTSRWTLLADNADSEETNQRAAEQFAKALAMDSSNGQARLGRLVTEKNRGYDLLWTRNEPGLARDQFERTLAKLESWHDTPPELRSALKALEIQLLARMGDALYALEDVPAALRSYRMAEAHLRAGLAEQDTVAQLDCLGDVLFHISGSLAEIGGQQEAALAAAAEGIEVMERVLEHGYDASAEKRLLVLLGQHADVLIQMQRAEAGLQSSLRSVGLRRSRLAAAPNNPTRRRDMVIGLGAHADVLSASGRTADACGTAQEVEKLWAGIDELNQLSERDRQRNVPAARARTQRYCSGS